MTWVRIGEDGAEAKYRYVIIPGGVLAGHPTFGLVKGYTKAELKAMLYEQVVKLFNLSENGTHK